MRQSGAMSASRGRSDGAKRVSMRMPDERRGEAEGAARQR